MLLHACMHADSGYNALHSTQYIMFLHNTKFSPLIYKIMYCKSIPYDYGMPNVYRNITV